MSRTRLSVLGSSSVSNDGLLSRTHLAEQAPEDPSSPLTEF